MPDNENWYTQQTSTYQEYERCLRSLRVTPQKISLAFSADAALSGVKRFSYDTSGEDKDFKELTADDVKEEILRIKTLTNPGDLFHIREKQPTVAEMQVLTSLCQAHNSNNVAAIELLNKHYVMQMQATSMMLDVYRSLGKNRKAKQAMALSMFLTEVRDLLCVVSGVFGTAPTSSDDGTGVVDVVLENGCSLTIPYFFPKDSTSYVSQSDVGNLVSVRLNKDSDSSPTYHGKIVKKNTLLVEEMSLLSRMWLGLLFADEDDDERTTEENDTLMRIQAYVQLGDNYEGKHKYCNTMLKALDAKILATTPPNSKVGTVTSEPYVEDNQERIKIKVSGSDEETAYLLPRNVAFFLKLRIGTRLKFLEQGTEAPHKCIPVAVYGYGDADYSSKWEAEKDMWKALGANLSYNGVVHTATPEGKSDVSREYHYYRWQKQLERDELQWRQINMRDQHAEHIGNTYTRENEQEGSTSARKLREAQLEEMRWRQIGMQDQHAEHIGSTNILSGEQEGATSAKKIREAQLEEIQWRQVGMQDQHAEHIGGTHVLTGEQEGTTSTRKLREAQLEQLRMDAYRTFENAPEARRYLAKLFAGVDGVASGDVWKAAGADDNFDSTLKGLRSLTRLDNDAATQAMVTYYQEMILRIQAYANLHDDFVGKMRLCEKYIDDLRSRFAPTGQFASDPVSKMAEREVGVWTDLVADCAIKLKHTKQIMRSRLEGQGAGQEVR